HRPLPGVGDLSLVLGRAFRRAGLQAGGRVLGHGDHADLAADRAVPGAGVLMDFFSLRFLNYLISLGTISAIYAVLCLGLHLQWGLAGLFNAGMAAFFAVGAYTAAILTTPESPHYLGGFGLPIVLAWPIAMLASGALAWVVGRICVRLQGDYLAMATIGI